MKASTIKPAIVYCRVSDPKQALSRGDGLHSQENSCRDYALRNGYAVVDVFTDMATGKTTNRKGLKAVLAYLRQNPGTTLIVDHANRLGRNLLDYKLLRREITQAGGLLKSPVMDFEETSSSMLVENVVASVSEYQSLHNAEQATSRMMARVRNGFNVFQAPAGYRYVAMRGQGKVLQPVEPAASVMREALEGYASGRFEQQADVMRFLQDNPLFPKDKTGRVRHQRVGQLLRCVVYAGMVEAPNWNIERREGQHEGLISFLRIQDRLAGKTYAPRQKNLNEDFPLRGFVTCDDCDSPLTACWSKGTHSRHPYYLCPKRGCISYGKSIRRDVIEGEFDELLKTVVPTPGLFAIASRMFKQQWDHEIAQGASQAKQLTAELAKTDKQVGQLLERVMEASLPSVAKAYEAKIAELEDRKLVLREKIATGVQPRSSFDQTLRAFSDQSAS